MRYLSSVALVALLLAAPGAALAQAQPTPAQIRAAAEAFDRGREAYKAEQYQEAAEQFERADANAPSNTALELALRSRDQAGNADRAATLAALALVRHSDNQGLVSLAEEVLERNRGTLYELRVTCSEACQLVADAKIVHGAPATERSVFLQAGKHAMVADFGDGRTSTKTVEASEGGSGELSFDPPADASESAPAPIADEPSLVPEDDDPAMHDEEPEEPKDSGGWSPAVFWVSAGLTAVAGGVTIWSGMDTMNDPGADRVREECSDTDCELYKEGVAKQNRTNVLLGVTGGLALATILIGAVATDWGGGGSKEEARLTTKKARQGFRSVELTPWIDPLGAGLGARGRF